MAFYEYLNKSNDIMGVTLNVVAIGKFGMQYFDQFVSLMSFIGTSSKPTTLVFGLTLHDFTYSPNIRCHIINA